MKKPLLLLTISVVTIQHIYAATYYIDKKGDNNNSGRSLDNAWKTFSHLSSLTFKPGDRIILNGPHNYNGGLKLVGQKGTKEKPIVITSADPGNPATINSQGFPACVELQDCSYIEVNNLKLTGNGGGLHKKLPLNEMMRCGVLVINRDGHKHRGFTLKKLQIKDIYFNKTGFKRDEKEVRTANGTGIYGWGIRFINKTDSGKLDDILVEDCHIENVAHTAIKFTSKRDGINGVKVYRNTVLKSGGPGIQISCVRNGHFSHNVVNYSGSPDDTRKWGRGSGLWTWGVDGILIEHNKFMNANGPGDSAGAHIDFNSNNVVMQYNFSANNAGGFAEILGNNHNCSYRYNVSVNDGHRTKGRNGNFQEGKILWLSGYVGRGKSKHGPYNSYIYNNTIYVNKSIDPKISFFPGAKGVFIANNIICTSKKILNVGGDQGNLVRGKKSKKIKKKQVTGNSIENMIFENNLYLSNDSWPERCIARDNAPVYGDPKFVNPGGMDVKDYIPRNIELIKGKGIVIPTLPGDTIGLKIGLKVTKDILGNPVRTLPGMGAIECE